MFLHISNLVHLIFIASVWLSIEMYLRRTAVSRFRAALRLLQVLPILFVLDVLIGALVIEEIYGSHQSAGWIAKSLWLFPGLFLMSIWRMLRARKQTSPS
jgi:hypothetical protein